MMAFMRDPNLPAIVSGDITLVDTPPSAKYLWSCAVVEIVDNEIVSRSVPDGDKLWLNSQNIPVVTIELAANTADTC